MTPPRKPKHKRVHVWLSIETVRDIEILKRIWRVGTVRDVLERAVMETARRERGLDDGK